MQASPAVCTWSRGIQLGHVVQHEAFHQAVLVRLHKLQHLLHLLQGSCLHLNGNVLVFSPHPVLQITHAYALAMSSPAPQACLLTKQCNQLYKQRDLVRAIGLVTYQLNPTYSQHTFKQSGQKQEAYCTSSNAFNVLVTQVTSFNAKAQSANLRGNCFVRMKARMVHALM